LYNDQSESIWIQKIKTGDSDAFEKLFRQYCQPLINFARHFVRDTQIAENIVQDVFLRIWANRTHLNPSSNIKTYLYCAVKNHAINYLRHAHVENRSVDVLKNMNSPVRTPEEKWQEKEMKASIHLAIEELPEKCRLIFCMSRYDHLTYAEIADIQNLSIKTVETHMGRALKFLRKRLAPFLISLLF
jgi:RNA polymerase sigma-70 factor (ECF subfamily)